MKNVLVPTDITDCTKNTLNYAINLAVKNNVKLFFYHADGSRGKDKQEEIFNFIQDAFSNLNLNIENFQTE
jgi:hypothetical protein